MGDRRPNYRDDIIHVLLSILFKARAAFAAKVHLLEQKVLVPADVAKSIVFLASDAASRITGVLLPVDGGFMLSSPAYDFAGTQAIPGLEQEK